jgi:hypothetical protein
MGKKRIPLFGEDDATALLAKAIALEAFRHPLEDLHAGTFPSSKTGDYSDVKVVSPYGEIPWTALSRISDEEMKELMREVVSKLFSLLVGLDSQGVQAAVMARAFDFVSRWDDPLVDENMMEGILNSTVVGSRDLFDHIMKTVIDSDQKRRIQFRSAASSD